MVMMLLLKCFTNMRGLLRATATVLLLFCALTMQAQNERFDVLDKQLTLLATEIPGLSEQVNFSMSGASLQEFMRGLAKAHNLNLSVDPSIDARIVNNFTNARVKDVLVFVCKEYELQINFTGSILSFGKYTAPVVLTVVEAKSIELSYDEQTNFLSLNLRNDSIEAVARAIAKVSSKNVIVSPEVRGTIVRNAFIQNRPFDYALENMAYTEGLIVTQTNDGAYRIEKNPTPVAGNPRTGAAGSTAAPTAGFTYVVNNDLLSVDAVGQSIADIIATVSNEMHKNYFIFNAVEGTATLSMKDVTYDEFMSYLLNGTTYTYRNQEEVYLIGKRSLEGLRTTELIRMENRTIETVIDFIPTDLKTGVEISEFAELNGLIVSGSYPNILEVKDFLTQIDQVVPMVMVEVMIVDVNKSEFMKAGLTAGLGNAPEATSGTFNGNGTQTGGLNMELNSESINTLINSFNGFGFINLGNVTPDFYVNLTALESDNFVRIRHKPRLATLNGHEANLKIGKTEYYAESRFSSQGQLTPTVIQETTYKNTTADLSITITPHVSSGDVITLDIAVEQSDFVGSSAPGQPRDQFSRSFQSLIRVENGDMIVLGGLESKESGNTSDGLPFLARVPVIKWFFGTTSKTKNKSELNVFIKATVIY